MIDGEKGQKGFHTFMKSQDKVIVHALNKQCFSAGFTLEPRFLNGNNNKNFLNI